MSCLIEQDEVFDGYVLHLYHLASHLSLNIGLKELCVLLFSKLCVSNTCLQNCKLASAVFLSLMNLAWMRYSVSLK